MCLKNPVKSQNNLFKESIVKSQNNVFKEMQKSHKGYLSDIGNRHMAQNLLKYKSQGDR